MRYKLWITVSALAGLWALAQGLPDGPGKDLVAQKCSTCHGLEVVQSQKLNATDWDFLVGQMISNGAVVSADERKVIVEYLVAHFGPTGTVQVPASAEDGAKIYGNCQGCHQASGKGIAGAFPPLAGHVPTILAAKGGREFLTLVVINGMQGPIQVGGVNYTTPMPGFASLNDAQVAAVLNHIATAWDNAKALKDFKPYTAEEIKGLRKQLTPQQVHAERTKLGLK